MKKIYLLAMAVAVSGVSFGQKVVSGVKDMRKKDVVSTADYRTPTDTLLPGNYESASSFTLGTAQGGGYIVGNNGYEDKAKAQQFILTEPTLVEGALFWFGAKEYGSGNSSSVIAAKMYKMDGTGNIDDGTGNQTTGPVPGTELASVNIAVADVDTGTSTTLTYGQFSSPVFIDEDFALGFDVTGLAAGDTVGLVSTADGEGGGAQLSFEKWSDNSWWSMLLAWPLDLDFAVFAVVDNSSSGVEDGNFFEGIKMSQNAPNPAFGITTIDFELEKYTEKLNLEVFDMTGRKVVNIERNELASGRHSLNFDASVLSSGTYFYSIKTDTGRITKRMVITK